MTTTLYTIGYGSWKDTKRRMSGMLAALRAAQITTLLDIRISPCASDPGENGNYTARDWNLQGEGGIAESLKNVGIDYRWMVELGNPQKRDHTMAVLHSHIASTHEMWPVNRGLLSLRELLQDQHKRYCLLCACDTYDECHRRVISESLNHRYFAGSLNIIDITRSGNVDCRGP